MKLDEICLEVKEKKKWAGFSYGKDSQFLDVEYKF